MSTTIKPTRPPSPKRQKNISELAQIADAFLAAAESALFTAKERARFELYARAYFEFLLEDAPAKLVKSASGRRRV